MQPYSQANVDASRKAALIEKHAAEYERDPIYRHIIDNTVFLTLDQIHESMKVVGWAHKGDV